ncbi:dynein light chain 4, axonemal-like [Eurytemora carolleeae]|uniref:dynein light chain 4, axonemal-like n=1 Tax=Eurytemora carolleeae TaxID=1294199 RepID=UPI000C77CC1E|nr:dynein light chain 4, axonemal-like [Eurytemora carolleeae]|eukprot:XP_023335664.1 dynein light chain 4, axonemal-like [Eurytemora affinis]
MRNEQAEEDVGASKRIIFTYPMVSHTDMTEIMKTETLELCTNACEKHVNNNELAAKMIKENLDIKYGPTWHVVVGEGFSFDLTYEVK